MNEGWWVSIGLVLALASALFGFDAGQATLASDCDTFGAFKHGNKIYTCAVKK